MEGERVKMKIELASVLSREKGANIVRRFVDELMSEIHQNLC